MEALQNVAQQYGQNKMQESNTPLRSGADF